MRLAFIAAEAERVVKRRRRGWCSNKNRPSISDEEKGRSSSSRFSTPDDRERSESREELPFGGDDAGWRSWKRKRQRPLYSILRAPTPFTRRSHYDRGFYVGDRAYESPFLVRRWTRPRARATPLWPNEKGSGCVTGKNFAAHAQYIVDQNINCRTIYGPLLALWHLASVSLFLLATLAFAGVMADTSSMEGSSRSEGTRVKLVVVDSIKKGVSGSCSRYDYFLSLPLPSSSSTARQPVSSKLITTAETPISGSTSPKSADDSDLVKRSTSPLFTSNPALDNVFSIWLRASRSSRTSSVDDGDSPASEFVVPVNSQSRNRYQYYYSSSDGVGPAIDEAPSVGGGGGNAIAKLRSGKDLKEGSGDDEEFLEVGGEDSTMAYPSSAIGSNNKILQCELFDEQRIDELCAMDAKNRVSKLRRVFVRTDMGTNRPSLITEAGNSHSNYNCNSSNSTRSTTANGTATLQPMTLYTFFQLDISYDGALAKSNALRHLAPEFRPCILSAPENPRLSSTDFPNSTKPDSCRTCYANVLNRLNMVDSRQRNFSLSVLPMLDCEPDNDLEQFSPTSNCLECKVWYRRWLLIILTAVWKQKPCLQWCNLAELACPHLPPVRRNDYAGLPSFRCTDPEIGVSWNSNSTYGLPCDCMHPCDPQAPTIYWGWNVIGERPEYCKDYKRRDCPSTRNKASIDRRITTTTASSPSIVPASVTATAADRRLAGTGTQKGKAHERTSSPSRNDVSSVLFRAYSYGKLAWTLTIYGFIRWHYRFGGS